MLFYQTGHNHWTDLDEFQWMYLPNIVLQAADAEAYVVDYDRQERQRFDRHVLYRHTDGKLYTITLTPFVMPDGAADLTINIAGTSQIEGKFLLETGALCGARAEVQAVAGMLMPFYYLDNDEDQYVTTLKKRDFIWLIREGSVEALNGNVAATAIGDLAVTGAAGAADKGTAIGAGYAQAAAEDALPTRMNIGFWAAVVGAAAVGRMELRMQKRFPIPA